MKKMELIKAMMEIMANAEIWVDYQESNQIETAFKDAGLTWDDEELEEEEGQGFTWFDCYYVAKERIDFKYKCTIGHDIEYDIVYSNDKNIIIDYVKSKYYIWLEENGIEEIEVEEVE